MSQEDPTQTPADRMVAEFVGFPPDAGETPETPEAPEASEAQGEPAPKRRRRGWRPRRSSSAASARLETAPEVQEVPEPDPAPEPEAEIAAESAPRPHEPETPEPEAKGPEAEEPEPATPDPFVSVDPYAPDAPATSAPRATRVVNEPQPATQRKLPPLDIRESKAIVAGQNLYKQFGSGPAAVHALNGVSIELYPGTFTAIMGPSGSGKSTLMHLLAGLDTPTKGEVWIGPTRLGELGEADRTRLRRSRVGFVFQSFNLLPMLTVEQNITLPQRIAGRRVDTAWLDWLLVAIGLPDRRKSRPAELSGGEQQRVSLARALLGKPTVVFADEPTGNLDSRSSEVILTMLRRAVADLGQTIVIVTHDPQAAARADRVVFLEDGRIVRET